MKNDWDDREGRLQLSELDQCIVASHLIGKEKALVLPGFGSVSVKVPSRNLFGEVEDILWISAEGQDLETIGSDGFTPLHQNTIASLGALDNVLDEQYKNALCCSRVQAVAPFPPPEAILHAILPGRYVFFTCPEALLAIANTIGSRERLHEIYQDRLLIIEGVRLDFSSMQAGIKGIDLSESTQIDGILFLGLGLFTSGDHAREVYTQTIRLVSQAEQYLQDHQAWDLQAPFGTVSELPLRQYLPYLRQTVSDLAGFPIVLGMDQDPVCLGFCQSEDLQDISQLGLVTPAQAALGLPPPSLKKDLEAYHQQVESIPDQPRSGGERATIAPPVILDPELGMLVAGGTAREANLIAEVYRQAIRVFLHAQALGGFQALLPQNPSGDRAALRVLPGKQTAGNSGIFSGEIALVTGGASGIGKACVESLLARGAAVASMDINPQVKNLYDRPAYLGLECDLTDEASVIRGFETLARTFGGLDMLVLNAGIFPAGIRIDSLDLAAWQKVMRINLDSYLTVMREAYPLLKCSPRHGRVVLNASKNVLAPGAGAAAYSASKAAVTQLARVAALEWGKEHIRINMIHPDSVYDTGIWTEEVLNARAAYYGMSVQQYKTRNLLGVEIDSHYVGELVAEMLGPLFEKITGAQIPVDGGSDRVI